MVLKNQSLVGSYLLTCQLLDRYLSPRIHHHTEKGNLTTLYLEATYRIRVFIKVTKILLSKWSCYIIFSAVIQNNSIAFICQ